ncbi:MAG: CaiB/BaiF CoA transferase family protein [Nitrospinota bacterium]
MPLPLDDVRVLSLGVSISAPLTARYLADLGAEVIKVEMPGKGDLAREWDTVVRGESAAHFWVNPNKKSITVNLKAPKGREIILRLAARSDIFLENFSPGAVDRLGLGYGAIREVSPRIIYLHASGYGQDGPYREGKAFDMLIQGEAGFVDPTGTPEQPCKVAVSICDGLTGLWGALSLLAAIRHRDRTGEGQELDLSMFDCAVSMLGYFPFYYWYRGEVPTREGIRHWMIIPYGGFRAADGKWVSFACGSQVLWEKFCEVVGREEWLSDPRFSDNEARVRNRETLNAEIERLIAAAPRDAWLEKFRQAGIPCGAVNNLAEVCEHPQTLHRNLFPEVEGPYGRVHIGKFPVRMGRITPRLAPPPRLGEHTEEVLRELGYSPQEVEAMRREGII